MPRTKLSEYSTTNSDNTDIESINIAEGCAPSGINNAIRELMVHLKEFQTGASGDAFTFAGGVLISGTANTITGNVLMSGTNTITGSTTATFAAGAVGTPSIAAHGDTNTGIFFPAADTIAFAEGGAEAMRIDSSGNVGIGTSSPNSFTAENDSKLTVGTGSGNGGITIYTGNTAQGGIFFADGTTGADTYSGILRYNHSSNAMLFYTNGLNERMRIDSSGNVGIGGAPSTATRTTVQNVGSPVGYWVSSGVMQIQSNAVYNGADKFIGSGYALYYAQDPSGGNHVWATSTASGTAGNNITFTERARITSGGVFCVGTTSTDPRVDNVAGVAIGVVAGIGIFSRTSGPAIDVNRKTDDGALVNFAQDGTIEGTISVSGNTVSYNAFTGGHWSQLQEGRGYNPEIPRGTVMSTIGEMCEWKSVVWDEVIEHPAVPAVEAKEAVLDEEGNVIESAVEEVKGKDAWTETINKRDSYLGQLPIGATFEEDGVTKTVVDDGNERLPKVKISDVVGDKAVYGVFQTWDEVQDMLVTSLGAFVVRIASGVTVQIGDLLESNGDGCAKVQDDDVIRSKTIAKVTSTTPTATYADGSYTVPAVIYCG